MDFENRKRSLLFHFGMYFELTNYYVSKTPTRYVIAFLFLCTCIHVHTYTPDGCQFMETFVWKKKIHKKDEISCWKIRLIKTNACFIVSSFNFTLKTAFRNCLVLRQNTTKKKKKKNADGKRITMRSIVPNTLANRSSPVASLTNFQIWTIFSLFLYIRIFVNTSWSNILRTFHFFIVLKHL